MAQAHEGPREHTGDTVARSARAGLAAAAPRSERRKAESPVGASLHILIIDDDPLVIEALQHILAADGHTVVPACDGRLGVAAFLGAQLQGLPFSLVITDLGMPGLDGREVAATVKAAAPDTPVILLTGWGDEMRAQHDLPEHVDLLLSKPPRLSQLRAAFAELMGAESQGLSPSPLAPLPQAGEGKVGFSLRK